MTDCRLVYITATNMEKARALAQTLVRERLAACVNLLGAIESVYWWDGQVESSQEVSILAKTTLDCVPALTQRIQELHDYDCPCVVAWPLTEGHPAFLAWIKQETGAG